MDINNIIREFSDGKINPEQLRDGLKKEIDRTGLELKQLQKVTTLDTSTPEATAKAVEVGMFMQNLYKAKRGDYAAAKVLEGWRGKASTLIEGSDSLGGYLVPEELENSLVQFIEGASVIMPHCRKFSMNSDTKNIPTLDSDVATTFNAESSAITESNPTFGTAQLKTYRQDGFSTISNELLEDSDVNIIDMMLSQFTEQMGRGLDDVILNGVGDEASAAHSGIFTAAVAYSTVMETGSAAFSTILVSNLVELYHSVPSYAREKGIFVMHSDIAKYLQLEKDNNGAYRWNPYVGTDMRVHGKFPIVESIAAPSDSDSGASTAFVAFGNFSYLGVGLRKGISMLVDPYTNAASYQSRIIVARRLALAYLKTGAFARLLTAS